MTLTIRLTRKRRDGGWMNKGKNSYLAILNDIEPDNQPYVVLGTISGILLGTHISDRKRLESDLDDL